MKIPLCKGYLRAAAVVLLSLAALLFGGCEFGNKYTHITPQEAQAMMDKESDYVIVDVRTPEEYEKRHVKGAISLPMDDIKQGEVEKTLPDKDQILLLYCWTGRRSEDSAKLLAQMGYRRVYEFGGLVDWQGETTVGNEP